VNEKGIGMNGFSHTPQSQSKAKFRSRSRIKNKKKKKKGKERNQRTLSNTLQIAIVIE